MPVGRFVARFPWVVELVLLGAIVATYQGVKLHTYADPARAYRNAQVLLDTERAAHLDLERSLQQAALASPRAIDAANYFYIYSHFTVAGLFFLWLFLAHRRHYALVRNAFAISHVFGLALFALFPCAPPRMLPGFVDTVAVMRGGLPYDDLHNPFAAFPSMHFAYAFLFAVVMVTIGRGTGPRLAGPIYAALVFVVMTVTANHYVVDSLASAVLVAASLGLAWLLERRGRGRTT